MKILNSQNIVYYFDCKHTPAVTVEPSEYLMVETLDARSGNLRKESDVHWTTPDFSSLIPKVNPATGPIEVRGAQPGDAVTVKIEEILLNSQGFVLVKPGCGIIEDMVSKPIAKIISVKNGYLYFSPDIQFPVRPMVGVIGTAPQKATPATSMVGHWGGNLDNNRISPGATVFLPAFVNGAWIYIGDVHARMGDGEATGTGVEICAKITVKIDLLKNAQLNFPYIETDDLIITMGTGNEFYKAAKLAVEEMIKKLVKLKGISREEAYMLISIAGDVRLNQACKCPTDISVRVEFPKKDL
jgi:amidase